MAGLGSSALLNRAEGDLMRIVQGRWARAAAAVAAITVATACGSPEPAGDGTPTTAPPSSPAPRADVIFHNGVVVTMDGGLPAAESVAVTDGVIVAVGDQASILSRQGPGTRVVDLAGRTVLPGFVDPHVHYIHNVAGDLGAMTADQETLLSWGRTTIGIPSARPENMRAFLELVDSGELVLRLHTYLAWNTNCGDRLDTSFWDEYDFDYQVDHRFAVAGVKVFMDGGSCHGPAVSFNFDDAPIGLPDGWRGHGDLFTTAEQLADVVTQVDAEGGRVVVHAIGDRAIEEAFKGYEQAIVEGEARPGLHRIDHNTFVRPELEGQYGEIGVNAVVWGLFNACIEPDRGWASFLTAEELGWLRRHRMLIDANPDITVAFHSDAPATNGDPFHQLLGMTEMAQYDEDFGGECDAPPWLAGHEVTIEEALQMMTIRAAEVMGIADGVGSIEVGKRADLVILDNNPLEQSGFDLLDNQVSATVVEGEIVWCGASWLCGES